MAENESRSGQVPESTTLKKTRLSLVWIVPIVAALIGVWVAAVTILNQGPKITIIFRTAEGLEAGKTKIRYNGVDIGTIRSIRLSKDHRRVVATAEMAPKTEDLLVEDTRFWAVTPRISGASVTGLGTLISGAYIGVEIGKSPEKKSEFIALDTPPVVTADVPGRFFVLKTTDLGSVDYGTPIYFRRLKVGEVASYELDKNGRTLTVKIFVYAPYDQYVTPATLFWQASGIDVSLTATGVSVETPSVLSLLVGGVAFETPASGPALPPAEANTEFTLYATRVQAYRPPPKNPHTYVLVFRQSVRGLAVGAPVEFLGVPIGQVEDIQAEADLKTLDHRILVTITVDPQRLGVNLYGPGAKQSEIAAYRRVIERMVANGFRAQLRTGSLLTGAQYVELGMFRDAPPAQMDWSQSPARLATVPGSLDGIEENIASIIKKLDKVQTVEISEDLRKTLDSTRRTLDSATTVMGPGSGLDQEIAKTLHEVSGAARSLRVLTDYLEQHPEALIKGKSPEKGQ